jgi:hypothetical protein
MARGSLHHVQYIEVVDASGCHTTSMKGPMRRWARAGWAKAAKPSTKFREWTRSGMVLKNPFEKKKAVGLLPPCALARCRVSGPAVAPTSQASAPHPCINKTVQHCTNVAQGINLWPLPPACLCADGATVPVGGDVAAAPSTCCTPDDSSHPLAATACPLVPMGLPHAPPLAALHPDSGGLSAVDGVEAWAWRGQGHGDSMLASCDQAAGALPHVEDVTARPGTTPLPLSTIPCEDGGRDDGGGSGGSGGGGGWKEDGCSAQGRVATLPQHLLAVGMPGGQSGEGPYFALSPHTLSHPVATHDKVQSGAGGSGSGRGSGSAWGGHGSGAGVHLVREAAHRQRYTPEPWGASPSPPCTPTPAAGSPTASGTAPRQGPTPTPRAAAASASSAARPSPSAACSPPPSSSSPLGATPLPHPHPNHHSPQHLGPSGSHSHSHGRAPRPRTLRRARIQVAAPPPVRMVALLPLMLASGYGGGGGGAGGGGGGAVGGTHGVGVHWATPGDVDLPTLTLRPSLKQCAALTARLVPLGDPNPSPGPSPTPGTSPPQAQVTSGHSPSPTHTPGAGQHGAVPRAVEATAAVAGEESGAGDSTHKRAACIGACGGTPFSLVRAASSTSALGSPQVSPTSPGVRTPSPASSPTPTPTSCTASAPNAQPVGAPVSPGPPATALLPDGSFAFEALGFSAPINPSDPCTALVIFPTPPGCQPPVFRVRLRRAAACVPGTYAAHVQFSSPVAELSVTVVTVTVRVLARDTPGLPPVLTQTLPVWMNQVGTAACVALLSLLLLCCLCFAAVGVVVFRCWLVAAGLWLLVCGSHCCCSPFHPLNPPPCLSTVESGASPSAGAPQQQCCIQGPTPW